MQADLTSTQLIQDANHSVRYECSIAVNGTNALSAAIQAPLD